MKRFLLYILIPLATLLAGCQEEEVKVPDIPKTTPRAVLVYMVANNSLGRDGYDRSDLYEMMMAAEQGDFGDSRLIVYHHPRHELPVLKEITPEGVVALKTYDNEVFSSSSARMTEVIKDFKDVAPADNYGIILWSHGSGWLQDGYNESIENADESTGLNPGEIRPLSFGQDGMSSDARGSRWMNTTTLASTLEGKGFDYVYFDCCYMGGIEVMYQMRNVAKYIVASATELPADGMPYDLNLKYLLPAEADLVGAANSTFEYYNARSGENRTCTMVVVDTSALDRVATLTSEIFSYKHDTPAGFHPQKYTLETPCHYFDFKEYVEARSLDASLFELWTEAYDQLIVYKNQTPKLWNIIDLSRHSGLSTYIANRESDAQYKNYYQLDWCKDVVSILF